MVKNKSKELLPPERSKTMKRDETCKSIWQTSEKYVHAHIPRANWVGNINNGPSFPVEHAEQLQALSARSSAEPILIVNTMMSPHTRYSQGADQFQGLNTRDECQSCGYLGNTDPWPTKKQKGQHISKRKRPETSKSGAKQMINVPSSGIFTQYPSSRGNG